MSFLGSLLENAERHGDRRGLTWFDAEAREQRGLTVREQHQRARGLAGALLAEGLAPGERVLLVYPPGLDFFDAFLACLYAGLIPSPVYPPNPLEGERLGTLEALRQRLGARVALTNTTYDRVRAVGGLKNTLLRGPRWPTLRWLRTDRLAEAPPPPLPRAAPEDLAFVQFTSGSTSAPKGVRVTYGMLAHQHRLSQSHGGYDPDSRAVVWLPQYHDFGLVTSFLEGLFTPFALWMCSPLDFLKRPACWPEMMHKVQATHTAAPNFGYALVTRKTTPQERAAWDLSALRCVTWGAEVIRPETVRAFHEAFAASGLRPDASVSGWGLAEHLVAACSARTRVAWFDGRALEQDGVLVEVHADAPGALALTNAGGLSEHVELRIVDPEGRRRLPGGAVGEVWLRSGSVSEGYEADPEATARVFHNHLDGEGGGPWLRTGDLGALVGTQLYITGRLKELIILRGRNVHPTDVEAIARGAHEAIRPGGVAAFALPGDEGEALALAVELAEPARWRRRLHEVAEALRAALTREGYPPACVALLPPRSLPKTTSGKLRRQACAALLQEGRLGGSKGPLLLLRWEPGDPAGEGLAEAVAALAALPAEQRPAAARRALEAALAERVGASPELLARPEVNLIELGLDSVAMAGLLGELSALTGTSPRGEALDGLVELGRLADWLAEAVATPAPAPTATAPRPAELPATDFQRLLLRDHGPHPAWMVALELRGPTTEAELRRGVEALVARHELLRAAFIERGDALWMRPSPGPIPVPLHTVEAVDEAGRRAALAEALRAPMDLSRPPLLRLVQVPCGEDRRLVGLAVHHLVYDARSMATLMGEWLDAPGGVAGEAPSFLDLAWSRQAEVPPVDAEGWWARTLQGARWPAPVRAVDPAQPRLVEAGVLTLSPERSAALGARARACGVTLNTLCAQAWGLASASAMGEPEWVTGVAISTRGPGEADVIGPLVEDIIVRVPARGAASARRHLLSLGEQLRLASARATLGFEAMQRRVAAPDSPSRALCPVLYTFHDHDALGASPTLARLQRGEEVQRGGLRLRALPLDRRNPARPYDHFALAERAEGALRLSLRVQEARVGTDRGAEILRRWGLALDLLLADPEQELRALVERLGAPP